MINTINHVDIKQIVGPGYWAEAETDNSVLVSVVNNNRPLAEQRIEIEKARAALKANGYRTWVSEYQNAFIFLKVRRAA